MKPNVRTILVLLVALLLPWGHLNSREPTRLRVLTYNIHHGEGTDGKINLDRLAKVILSTNPDIVALQEVDQGVERTGGVDQPAELSRLTGMEVLFGWNIHYEGGLYGNAVLTRLPVRRWENHPLPSHYEGEQRGVMEVEIAVSENEAEGGATVLFFATHLDYRPNSEERLTSADTIQKLIAERAGASAVLAGDLNDRPGSPPLKRFGQTWELAGEGGDYLTFPAGKPDRWIDYVLLSPKGAWKVTEMRVIEEPAASDHRPLLVVVERIEH